MAQGPRIQRFRTGWIATRLGRRSVRLQLAVLSTVAAGLVLSVGAGARVYSHWSGGTGEPSRLLLTATVATDIHDANHHAIASASLGATVHDSAQVSGGGATPTG